MRKRAVRRKFRRRCRLLGVLTLLMALLVALIPVDVFAVDESVVSGVCGESGVNWTIVSHEDATYSLHIDGTGSIPDYDRDANPAPWKAGVFTVTTSNAGASTSAEGSGSSSGTEGTNEAGGGDSSAGASGTEIVETIEVPVEKITKLEIGSGITGIGNYAFSDMSGLSGDLFVSERINKIGDNAFQGTGFTGTFSIAVASTSVDMTIGNYAFEGVKFTGTLLIPNRVTSIGESAFSGCDGFTGTLNLSDRLTVLNPNVFFGCSGFTGLNHLPAGIEEICGGAFQNCAKLKKSITIPAEVQKIGKDAFSQSGISGVGFAEGAKLSSIEEGAFYNCTGLTGTVVIPATVQSIGANAFNSINANVDLSKASDLNTIGQRAFSNCNAMSGALTIPAKVTELGSEAFNPSTVKMVTFLGDAIPNCDATDSVFPPGTIVFYPEGGIEGQWESQLGGSYEYVENDGSTGLKLLDNRDDAERTEAFDINILGSGQGLSGGMLIIDDVPEAEIPKIKAAITDFDDTKDEWAAFEVTYRDSNGNLLSTIPEKTIAMLSVPVTWTVPDNMDEVLRTMKAYTFTELSGGRYKAERAEYIKAGEKRNTIDFSAAHFSYFAVVKYADDESQAATSNTSASNGGGAASNASASNSGSSNGGASQSGAGSSNTGATPNPNPGASNTGSAQPGASNSSNSGSQQGGSNSAATHSATTQNARDTDLAIEASLASGSTPSSDVALVVDEANNPSAIGRIIDSDEEYKYDNAYPFSLSMLDTQANQPSSDTLSWNVKVQIPSDIVLANGEATLYELVGNSLRPVTVSEADPDANTVSFRTTLSGDAVDYVVLFNDTSKLPVQRLIDERRDRTDAGGAQRSTFDTSEKPLKTSRYLFITDSDGRAIDSMLSSEGTYAADKVSYFMLDMRDKAENGSRVTDFGECTINMTIPADMSPDLGNIRIAWADKDGKLHLEDAALSDSEGVTRLTFTTDYMSEGAIIYTRSNQSAHRLRILNRTQAIQGAVTGSVSVSPMPADWFLILSDVAASESTIMPLVRAEDALKGYSTFGVFDISLMDARENGNPVTNFGTCTVNIPLPDHIDVVNGLLRVVSIKGEALDTTIATAQYSNEEEPFVRFTTDHFSEFAVLYASNPDAILNANANASNSSASASSAASGNASSAASGASASASASASAGASGSAAAGTSASAAAGTSASAQASGGATNQAGAGSAAGTSGTGAGGMSNLASSILNNSGNVTTTITNPGTGDMPRTGDRTSYKTLIAIMLAILGAIELLISIPPRRRVRRA